MTNISELLINIDKFGHRIHFLRFLWEIIARKMLLVYQLLAPNISRCLPLINNMSASSKGTIGSSIRLEPVAADVTEVIDTQA